MNRSKRKKLAATALIIVANLILALVMPSAFSASALKGTKSGFAVPTLTGNQAADVAAVAKANIGKTYSNYGYTSDWCAWFATDCATIAGVPTSIVPSYASTTLFYENMVNNRNATVIKRYSSSENKVYSDPKPGDYIMFRWDQKGYTDGKGLSDSMNHVAIVTAYNSSTKKVTYVGGNQDGNTSSSAYYKTSKVSQATLAVTDKQIARIIRPAYSTDSVSVSVKFYRNQNASDTTTVTETFTTGVSNQKFGHKTDGTGRYSAMNDASVGFGQWTNTGCRLLGWSKDRNATTASWSTYSGVTDFWITSNAPSINLYAVWEKPKFSGLGTAEDPYLITNKEDLKELARLVNTNTDNFYTTRHYKQTADIDLEGEKWIPIGSFYENDTSTTKDDRKVFNGHYDGDYHTITNLNVDYDRNYAGLFGRLNGSAVIENLSVSGDVIGTDGYVGGIIGEMGYGAAIENCDFSGTVTGNRSVGGIAGKIHRGGTVSSCYVNGIITATGENCNVGGIASEIQMGDHSSSKDVFITQCYFAGKVNGDVNGAILGKISIGTVIDNKATFSGNYYLDGSADGAVGAENQNGCQKMTSEKLKNAAEYLGYPYVKAGAGQNDGYPVFEWQKKNSYGDINSDGSVDVADAVLLQGYLLGRDILTDEQYLTADINSDGRTDVYDMILMRQLIVS